jgi:hypothetical protein
LACLAFLRLETDSSQRGQIVTVTNNMGAEYGRSAGATVNVASKSGTNHFRGAAWEFWRDTSLNATGFFKPASGQKPPLERNQFGGAFGGPIVRNRAFFFGEYEAFRQTRGTTSTITIPTLAQQQGLLTLDVRDPRTGTVYPAGTPIPMTAFARKVLTDLPDPTSPGTAQNYSTLQEQTIDIDKGSGKVDYQFSAALNFFGRYGHRVLDTVDQPNIPLPSGGAGNAFTYATNKQFATGFTWARSGTSLVEGRFGWGDTVAGKNPYALGTASAQEAYGITGLPTDPRVSGGLPTQLVSGYADLGRQATNPQWQYPTLWNPKINQLHVGRGEALAQDRLRVPVHPDRGAGRQPALRARPVRRQPLAARWSKAQDNGAGTLENPNGDLPSPQDFYNLDADYGTSAFDEPYNSTTSFVWDLPVGAGRRWLSDANGFVDALVGGWTVSGIFLIKSGEAATLRYNPIAAFQVSGIQQDFRGANMYRPNVIGAPYGDRNAVTGYFNPANVVIPTDPSQPFGNAERNSVRGPGYWSVDFVAAKDFRIPLGDQTRVQVRAEAFNLFNHTNFRAPGTNRSTAAFGVITSTWDARQIQLGVKLMF